MVGPVTLDVRSDVGGITLTVGAADKVRVHAVLRAEYGPFSRPLVESHLHALEQHPPIEQDGNKLRIGYVADPSLLNGISMHLNIEVPRNSELRASAHSGGISVLGILGPLDARTRSGAIEIGNVGGQVNAVTESGSITIDNTHGPVISRTGSGHIEITGVKGRVDATTRSGHIVVRKANGSVTARDGSGGIEATQIAGALDAQTGSGAIRLSQTKPAPVRAQAHSGAIRIELAAASGYAIDAKSRSGRVSAPPLTTNAPPEPHVALGNIGGGGPLVDLDTTSGKIVISQGT